MSEDRIITFLSDFGTLEYYTGAVKGAILSVNPSARIIDLSHDIPSHDLLCAAFTIYGCYLNFPPSTIHLIVVDPGVGSKRRGLVMRTDSGFFVAPDNGVLSLVMAHEETKRIVSIEAEHYFRKPVSPTFHGRDIFGPVAGWISKGIELSNIGSEVLDPVRMGLPATKESESNCLEGFVLHIDKFGNIITSISERDTKSLSDRGKTIQSFSINNREINQQVRFYSEGSDKDPFFLVGSAGFFEVSAQKQSAARIIGAQRGMKVGVHFQDPH